ncbi:hypothetical protein BSFA1_87200 (plasmid) [Burkholderia sp. SFA1]|nr:hypothetical protein BSFA1_87200 [Burkholderia sp. SFA1]
MQEHWLGSLQVSAAPNVQISIGVDTNDADKRLSDANRICAELIKRYRPDVVDVPQAEKNWANDQFPNEYYLVWNFNGRNADGTENHPIGLKGGNGARRSCIVDFTARTSSADMDGRDVY